MKEKEYYILVAEPWDFVGPDGKNIIKGKILKIIDDDCILFKTNHKLRIKDVEGDVLVLSSRYKKDDHFVKDIKELDWTINVGLLLTKEYKDLNESGLKSYSKFIIIGSLMENPESRTD
ncbi:hypothetical protein LEP1GSC036_2294 [Leptospira weilii str. 2006001853]|uniref:Uncharacterized protein n=3 Tax=Leptospira weilii TaxID=28184 RepID=A0A828Z4Q2_9LEPT|nr:hypothetical protein [Leptospira weilii]EMM70938.1 hypothetical protein LEP1GSC038_0624 [Leptospira weilii str. 2006001855]EKR64987.1 hypothetical protein LEP1GSC036_2294 [Leptospira weilii str. 2006001853]EMN46790.1 hypothetical protein LEP1GSC086_2831 [Leptospira weilii str. LNT 1234]EMN89594.1 hypothetical protein LEP1GSC108_3778 [Leptospira weilii str. UI 13098]QDK25221.1 hypothetical protein FHG67_21205 [Leptospira weilii]